MATVLLTGASGLVGSRLLPRLAQFGFDCRALVRAELALPPGATAVRGDLLEDPSTLRSAVEGVDAVVHLAALFRTDDQDAIWRANLDGTRNLVDAVKHVRTCGPVRHGQHGQCLRRRRNTSRARDRRLFTDSSPTRRARLPPSRFCARAA